jgi:hypothetical protein
MANSDVELCLVVDDRGVLLGRIDARPQGGDPETPVGEIMRLAPGTEKPETFLHDLVDGLRATRFKRTILTGRIGEEAGRYLGVVLLEDAERTLDENAQLPS